MNAKSIIETLGMSPHPEGGWYVETFRDEAGGARGHSTAIYYLLEAGQQSHWHRVIDAAEGWHFYAGSALELNLSMDGIETEKHLLGLDFKRGERPQIMVPANHWQSARSIGAWTLVGCTVAPGFQFSSFEMAPPDWQPRSKPPHQ
jgi:uncharacterized protein